MASLTTLPARADAVRNAEWYLGYLRVNEAHKITQGNGVKVAIIDSGVDASHPDLQGNVLPGTDQYRDFKGDGRQDLNGHGTSMAALVAAHGKSPSSGALGIAPAAKILPIRDSVGGGARPEDLRASITWAIQQHVNVICIASGGAPSGEWAPVLQAALAADIVLVAAVGNRTQGDKVVGWPAAYPGVLAAAGIDQTGKHADLSVTGPEVDLAAPAVNIVTAGLHGQYVRADGTSAATAIIAGAAALVRSKYPHLSAAEVVHRLEATATDAGPPGRDDEYGYGILNLVGALTADVPPLSTKPTRTEESTPTTATPPDKTSGNALVGVLIALLLAAAAAGAVGVLLTVRRRRQ